MLRFGALIIAVAAFTACAVVWGGAARAGNTPEPSATVSPEPTATPFPPGATLIRARVIHDLNLNGAADPGEPGLEGWRVSQSWGDVVPGLPLTDTNGETAATPIAYPIDGVYHVRLFLETRFGVLLTSEPLLIGNLRPGETMDATFLVHDFNPDVMEIRAEVIVAGVPPPSFSATLPAPFEACGIVGRSNTKAVSVDLRFLILGDAARAGCLAPGQEMDVLIDGASAGRVTYGAGRTSDTDLVFGGESMRFYDTAITDARIGDKPCALIVEIDEQAPRPPGDSVRVFVLSEEARPGCGAPGRLVRFYRRGQPLEPRIPWVAGYVRPPTFASTIVPPETGSAGLLGPRR